MYDAILFDLDGTLTDSLPGIINGVQYAMSRMGRPPESLETIISFVGKPFYEALEEHYGQESPGFIEAMLGHFREYYADRGVYENTLYEGMDGLLEDLHTAGVPLAVATAKRQPSAELVLDHFGIAAYFQIVVGARSDGTFSVKADTIREVLRLMDTDGDRRIAMVGDRQYDMSGGAENGLEPIGILHGYGTREELASAGAEHIVEDVPALRQLLLG